MDTSLDFDDYRAIAAVSGRVRVDRSAFGQWADACAAQAIITDAAAESIVCFADGLSPGEPQLSLGEALFALYGSLVASGEALDLRAPDEDALFYQMVKETTEAVGQFFWFLAAAAQGAGQ